MEQDILFHTETGGTEVPTAQEPLLRQWIETVIQRKEGQAGAINYIFCGDEYLHQMNVEFLDHDTLTDIITFPYETFPLVSGDLFISTERVADNAADLQVAYQDELHRVIIHGVLHLCGQGDKTEEQAAEMRKLEDWALELRPKELLG
ncbi:rRNA maturation RNase YbeY [Neolewinella agarilytica]|uniref:rRNA maturation RNase YbeY n=1 Tax=Neolewinella agarilytica TaxID=478744 RepID=UPI0023530354|nr:rRNA maturation RNase YbeY [Neolewinella agarilytica]